MKGLYSRMLSLVFGLMRYERTDVLRLSVDLVHPGLQKVAQRFDFMHLQRKVEGRYSVHRIRDYWL